MMKTTALRSAARLMPAFFLFFLLQIQPAGAQWEKIDAPGTYGLYSISRIGNTFYALATPNVLYRSNNFGRKWEFCHAFPTIGGFDYHWMFARNNHLFVLYIQFGNGGFKLWHCLNNPDLFEEIPLPTDDYAPAAIMLTDEYIILKYSLSYNHHVYRAPLSQLSAGWTFVSDSLWGYDQSAYSGEELWLASSVNIIRSADYGDTWTSASKTFNDIFGFGAHDNTVIVSDSSGLYRSPDDGQTWEQVADSGKYEFRKFTYEDGNWYAVDKGYGSTYISDDDGKTFHKFTDIDVLLSPGTSLTSGSFHREGNLCVAPGGDGAWISTDGGLHWALNGTGFSYWGAWLPESFAEFDRYVYDGKWFSPDKGATWLAPYIEGNEFQTWDQYFAEKNDTLYVIHYNNQERGLYRATGLFEQWTRLDATGLNPSDGNTLPRNLWADDQYLYCAKDDSSLYRSADRGETWTKLNKTPFLAVTVLNFQNLLVAADYYGVWVSANRGLSWTSVFSFAPDYQSRPRLHVDKGFLYYSNAKYVYKALDGAHDWVQLNLTGDLGEMTGITLNDGIMLACGGYGVWASGDDGEHWLWATDGIDPNAADVYALGVSEGYAYACTKISRQRYRRPLQELRFAGVSGRIFEDVVANDTLDAGEPLLPGVLLRSSNKNVWTSSDSVGYYKIAADFQGDTVFPVRPTPYSTIVPPYYVVEDSVSRVDFAVTLTPGVKDLAVSAALNAPFRPGFHTTIMLTVSNRGTVDQSPVLRLNLAPDMEILSATPAADLTGADSLVWFLPDLPRFASTVVEIQLKTPVSLAIGTLVSGSAYVRPDAGDANIADNFDGFREAVVGSWDPNDKRVSPDPFTTADVAQQKRLAYTVRFQNTGNYPASFVRIADTLSPLLDWSTFRVEAFSHPMQWKLRGQGVVEFFFPDIDLPDSMSNEPASHGFVKYSIEAKKTLQLNDNVQNTAFIYFDYNVPVVTNTTESVVQLPLSVRPEERALPLHLWPNPAHDAVDIALPAGTYPGEDAYWEISEAGGRRVLRQSLLQTRFRVDVSAIPQGIYVLRVFSGTQLFSGKLTKM